MDAHVPQREIMARLVKSPTPRIGKSKLHQSVGISLRGVLELFPIRASLNGTRRQTDRPFTHLLLLLPLVPAWCRFGAIGRQARLHLGADRHDVRFGR